MRAILHIGASKCASSSLQWALSRRAVFASAAGARTYEYICLIENGEVLRGPRLDVLCRMAYSGYAASTEAERIAPDGPSARAARAVLAEMERQGRTPVISFEGWYRSHDAFREHDLLRRLGLEADILFIVRPPLDWVNSAWWQTGAFTYKTFADWMETRQWRPRWADRIEAWRALPGVRSVQVLLLGADIVERFFAAIEAPAPSFITVNKTLDGGILRFFQTRTDVSPQAKPGMDFALERHMGQSFKPPWIISRELARELMDYYADSNRRLLSMVPEEVRREMERDARWWNAEAYDHLQPEPPETMPLSYAELEGLVARSFETILRLDERLRQIEVNAWLSASAPEATPEVATQPASPASRPVRPFGRMLRKAVSINGVRRLVGA